MADYAITNVARRIVYTGSAGVGPYAFSFPILVNTDIAVYKNTTLLTLTTDYTVTISGTTGQGSVTLVVAATGADRITIVGARAIQRSTDFVTGGDFFANTLNTELDSETIFIQQIAETAERSIKAPVTDPTSIDMTLPANTTRANKFLSFNSTGNPQAVDSLGAYKGNWSASVAYVLQDIVKDTSNSNIYICISAHTSTGSQPISSNADVAKWSLVVDAAAAGTSATNAAASASAASTSATNAAASASTATTQASNASTSASTASTQASNASTSASNAASSASAASGSATTASTQASNASTSATNAASSASSASTSATNAANSATTATTQASNAATSASNASTSATSASGFATSASTQAGNAATSASNASTSATNAATSATNAATSATNAAASYDAFDDRYLGSKSSAPSVDNDGNALLTGALYYNTTASQLYVWNGSAWDAAAFSISGSVTSFSAGSTGFTPNTATTGAVTLGGTLAVGNGGTGTSTAFTAGSVLFSGASGVYSQDNANFFWDDTNNRLGIGTATPTQSLDVNGNLAITGSDRRITGDFSNATVANRVAFQTSTTNGNTAINAIPNGTSTTSSFQAFNTNDPANTSATQVLALSTESSFRNAINGTGTYLPMTFYTNGSERMRIDTSGNVGIGTTSVSNFGSTYRGLEVKGSDIGFIQASSAFTSTTVEIMGAGNIGYVGTRTNHPLALRTFDTERMRIDSSGNVGIGTSSPAITPKLTIQSTAGTNAYGGIRLLAGTVNSNQANYEAVGRRYDANISSSFGGGVLIARVNTAPAALTNGMAVGRVAFGGSYDGTDANIVYGSQIAGVTEGTYSNTSAPTGLAFYTTPSGTAGALTSGTGEAGTERMRIDSSGNVGIGTSSVLASTKLDVRGAIAAYDGGTQEVRLNTDGNIEIARTDAAPFIDFKSSTAEDYDCRIQQQSNGLAFQTGGNGTASERMRIDSSGNLLVGTTSYSTSVKGTGLGADGLAYHTRNADVPLIVNRLTNDGTLVSLQQATTEEGSISVSGTTVSYNGGHLARWSQLLDNSKDDTILKGTVLTNLDDMCVWVKDGETLPNEQLNKMKVSNVEGDTNVAGVFVNWTFDEQCQSDDMNVAMTGDMIIRIAEGVAVQKGDFLMSAGDGTAKPQGDDIVRSKTIAKVTSNHVTCTYADNSYCVPCVLMAC
jgi:hypothetical protein